jgi:nitrate/nitrite transport system permease protein
MSAAPAAKHDFETAEEIAAPADAVTVAAPSAEATGRRFPAWLKLPDARSAFDAVWPPLAGVVGFVLLWALLAPMVKTSLGSLPGPLEVWQAFVKLLDEYAVSRAAAADAAAAGLAYAGSPTFIGQIFTSLQTVALGFVLASIVAVPLGLVAGMSKRFNAAINPLVQVMRPVSPLAWLPIVTMVVSASMSSTDPLAPKSFVISAVVVMLCSLWPTLINTAVGTASIDKDLINVGRVLRLGWFQRLTRLILPSALPYIFTGLDGADRGRNARAEPGPGQVRVGRVSERQLGKPVADHGRGGGDRADRSAARPADDAAPVVRQPQSHDLSRKDTS